MDKLFWLIPGKLAGRAGPDREPWDLASLRSTGIGAVLSVNDGLLCHAEDFAAHGMSYACVPLPDNAPPQPGDDVVCLHALPKGYTFVAKHLGDRRTVLVHCSAGKDRTGLFLCYFLMRRAGLQPEQAIRTVREVRPTALSALGWEAFALQLLGEVAQRHRRKEERT